MRNEGRRGIGRLAGLAVALGCVAGAGAARADVVVYQSDFDALALGRTGPHPGAAGQDGWFQQLAVGDAYGEIQDAIANGGRALHEHTAASVPPASQTIDARLVGPVSLANVGAITLSVDFYASTSDLDAVNNYIAGLSVGGGPHPGFQIIGFGLGGGNGAAKSATGLNVSLATFNGSSNNEPIPLTVGQGLAWDTWHSITVSLDHHADTWLSITVDGQSQSLLGYRPMRSFDGAQWLRGPLIESLGAYVVPDDVGGDRTDDDVYFDNVRLSVRAVPEPSALVSAVLGLAGLGGVALRRRRSA